MSHWDRIALLNLSDAIKAYMKDADATDTKTLLLQPILHLCNHGSKSVGTSTRVLHEVKLQLMDVCRHHEIGNCSCSHAGADCGKCKLFRLGNR